MTQPKVNPVLLVVLDGFGLRAEREDNAVLLAGTPTLDAIRARYPYSKLHTSGLAVGLPEGQMGNSEVGHTNLGAGRVVYQDLVRINRACEAGTLGQAPALAEALDRAKRDNVALHLWGLVSPGGVHSSIEHLEALLEAARLKGVAQVFVHALTDGRDTPPRSALALFEKLEPRLGAQSWGRFATVGGRFFGMDRDQRWDRVARAHAALVSSEGFQARSALDAIQQGYARGEGDEFIQPTVVTDEAGKPVGPVRDGDVVVCFNFRADRARELTRALAEPGFAGFARTAVPKLGAYVCMTQYDETFHLPVAFAPEQPKQILPELLSQQGLRQFRTAETEKYAHVTFFFNGGREEVFPGEERGLVASPRDVKTYDLKPEMSAREVTDGLLKQIDSGQFQFMLVNFANPDMVGHTGKLDAAITAVKVVDECLGRLWTACQHKRVAMLITADHGNCELMRDPVTGEPHTSHTLNPVPLLVAAPDFVGAKLADGILADVAPTVCQVMGLQPTAPMTGHGLLSR
jgi:2,3-bisphosphoglycerate-independent phosphoglycerate mutase